MLGPNVTFPFGPGDGSGSGSGGPSAFSGRDIVWVDLRFPAGGAGNEMLPFNTANLGLGTVPDGGTLVMVGGDATTEPGVSIGARSFTAHGFGGQLNGGGLPPKLPTLTYAITTGTQRLEFHHISVSLVHSGTAASLTQFRFEFCPVITLTGGTDAPPVYWVGDGTCLFSGAGGPAELHGGTIDGYTANSGAVLLDGCSVTGNIESPTEVTILGGCSFTAISITAPSIKIDAASYYRAVAATVSFSSSAVILIATAAPVDIGTANAAGAAKTYSLSDHVHDLPFTPVQDALAAATSAVSFNSQRITNVAAPTSGGDAVNKTYADALASGLKVKTPVDAVSVANQATRSGTAQTIDGVALNTIGMRVLLTAQSTASQNGIWVIQSGSWTRPTDFSTGDGAAQSYCLVTAGTVYAGSGWFCTTTAGSDVIDTNNLTWVLFSQAAVITAGAGLTKTGNTLDVIAGDATLVVSADSMVVGVIGNANLANNTIALARLANAGAQYDFMMRVSASGGAWEDGTVAQARTALGIIAYGALYPVRAATTANITLSGTQTVDGVALIANDRCLVKDQSTGANNGVYVVAAGAWTRATDADGAGELVGGMLFPISEGTVNGNRVAMLTTNDPISIGSTALTFAMDRTVALGAVAPLDVTKSAAAIGTSTLAAPLDHKHDISTGVVIDIGTAANAEGTATSLARSDHAHRLTFTVVAAVLAAASAAIDVNLQRIFDLGAPVSANDAVRLVDLQAHPGIPGGSTTQLQYNNGGAFDGTSGITVVGSETALSFGTTTNVNSGDTRHAHGATVSAGRLSTGNSGVPILRWGFGTDNYIVIGGGTEGVAGLQLEVTTGSIELKVATAQEYLFSATALTMQNNNLVMGSGFASFGTTVPGAGAIRLARTSAIYSTTGSADRYIAGYETDNANYFGDSASAATYVRSGALVALRPSGAGADEYTFDSSTLNAQGNSVSNAGFYSTTGTVATTGQYRSAHNTGAYGRNNANTGNVPVWRWGAVTDVIVIGGGTEGVAGLQLEVTTGAIDLKIATAQEYGFTATALTMNNNNLVMGTGFISISNTPATAGDIRSGNDTGVLSWRNAANSANVAGMYLAAGDVLQIGQPVAAYLSPANTSIYAASGGGIQLKIANTDEFVFSGTAADFKDNILTFGTTPANSGIERFSFVASATTLLAFRNGANSADVNVIGFGSVGVNDVDVGSHNSTNGSRLNLYAANGIYLRPDNTGDPFFFDTGVFDVGGNSINATSLINLQVGGSPVFQMTTSGHTCFEAINMNGNAISGTEFVEYRNTTAPAAPGVLGWKIYCDSGTGNLMAKPSSGGTLRTLAVF
jgi:hypothetical protein